jgi:uncharacterized membrane protein YgdD (TMEM256/DUF423 family)
MHRNFLLVAALFGAIGVMCGAFGAHGLQKLTTDETVLHGFQTAVQYQLLHSITLLFVASMFERLSPKWMKWSGIFFISGIILFSGSLYILTFLKLQDSGMTKFIGPVTPLGGLCLILGWLFLAIAAAQKIRS